MPKEESWKILLLQQKAITEELEKEISKLKTEDIIVENEALRNELSKCKVQLSDADQQVARLSEENMRLKASLYEQIYNEKIAILNAVSRKTDVYYQNSINSEINRLNAFEQESFHRINNMTNALINHRVNSQDEIFLQLNELRQLLDYKVSEARRLFAEQASAYARNRDILYQKLRDEDISEEEMNRALKKVF